MAESTTKVTLLEGYRCRSYADGTVYIDADPEDDRVSPIGVEDIVPQEAYERPGTFEITVRFTPRADA